MIDGVEPSTAVSATTSMLPAPLGVLPGVAGARSVAASAASPAVGADAGAPVAWSPDAATRAFSLPGTLTAMPYGFRMRYVADGGFEFMGAFRLELPTAINWSR